MPSQSAERERLETIAAGRAYGLGANETMVRHSASIFARHWHGERCLEMGPAEGIMTGLLAARFARLVVVEGAESFCRDLRGRFPEAEVVNALFETFEPSHAFDTIVMGHVLEHVDDPQALLRRARDWLAPDGVVLAAVPNARSLHRQAAVLMGLLPGIHSFSPADVRHGHRRVYDVETLLRDVEGGGLRAIHRGGYWLKPVDNAQIEATWTPAMLDAFMRLGEQFPDIAAEIYVVAGR